VKYDKPLANFAFKFNLRRYTVTKDSVRQRLGDVSARHPEARPSRGTLKQVYNFLINR